MKYFHEGINAFMNLSRQYLQTVAGLDLIFYKIMLNSVSSFLLIFIGKTPHIKVLFQLSSNILLCVQFYFCLYALCSYNNLINQLEAACACTGN